MINFVKKFNFVICGTLLSLVAAILISMLTKYSLNDALFVLFGLSILFSSSSVLAEKKINTHIDHKNLEFLSDRDYEEINADDNKKRYTFTINTLVVGLILLIISLFV